VGVQKEGVRLPSYSSGEKGPVQQRHRNQIAKCLSHRALQKGSSLGGIGVRTPAKGLSIFLCAETSEEGKVGSACMEEAGLYYQKGKPRTREGAQVALIKHGRRFSSFFHSDRKLQEKKRGLDPDFPSALESGGPSFLHLGSRSKREKEERIAWLLCAGSRKSIFCDVIGMSKEKRKGGVTCTPSQGRGLFWLRTLRAGVGGRGKKSESLHLGQQERREDEIDRC